MIEILPLTPDQAKLVTEQDTIAQELQRLAEYDARAKLQLTMTEIQKRFFDAVKPVLDAFAPGEADQCRFIHDEAGVLCLEVVRRGPRPAPLIETVADLKGLPSPDAVMRGARTRAKAGRR